MSVITCIIPCYNEEQVLPLFYNEIKRVINDMNYVDFELLFVDDGSIDNTLEVIKELSINDKKVKYIFFQEILEKSLLYMQV